SRGTMFDRARLLNWPKELSGAIILKGDDVNSRSPDSSIRQSRFAQPLDQPRALREEDGVGRGIEERDIGDRVVWQQFAMPGHVGGSLGVMSAQRIDGGEHRIGLPAVRIFG